MKKLITNYAFDASARTVTLSDYASINLEGILLISNLEDNVDIYDSDDANKGATVATNVITLEHNTTAMDDADPLQIWYDDGDEVMGKTDDAAVVTDTTGSVSGKLRGLVKMFADMWDSTNHALKVVMVNKLEAIISGAENDSVLTKPGRRIDSYEATLLTANATTAQTVKAAVTSKSIYITDIIISTDTAGWIRIEDEDATTILIRKYFPANSIWSKSFITPKKAVSGKAVKVIAENAGNISVDMNGYAI